MIQYLPVAACVLIHPAYILSSAATMAHLFIWTCVADFFVAVIVIEEGLCLFAFLHFFEGNEVDVTEFVLVKAIEVTWVNVTIGFNDVGHLTLSKHATLVWWHAL